MPDRTTQEWALATGARRSSLLFYKSMRWLARAFLFRWLRVASRGVEHLDLEGSVLLAPVHRSNLDVVILASLGGRRMRALGKISLFENAVSAWVCAALGAVPLRRGVADREAMRSARSMLESGEEVIVFPEGTRQTGNEITGVFDGTAYLASKSGATIVPIGIAGTADALPAGAKFPKRRSPVAVVVAEPIPAPEGRMSRPQLTAFSAMIGERLQAAFDDANAMTEPSS